MATRAAGVFSSVVEERIKTVLLNSVKSWCKQWFRSSSVTVEFSFNKTLFSELDVVKPLELLHKGQGLQVFSSSAVTRESMLLDMFNCDQATLTYIENELEVNAFESSMDDFFQQLYRELEVSLERIKSTQAVLSMSIKLNNKELTLLLDNSLLTTLIEPSRVTSPNISSLSLALTSISVPVKIALSTEKVAFSKAISLQVGDVLTLNHAIDKPVPVEVNGEKNYLLSYLVRNMNNKAIIFTES
ncbi:FliM/FliN family flagellar motor C-terminal domain-containing protein [Pseudoalteromonas sp.]|uniref:FliM/FliN family flagellar motor C-terminal domain-containing protein n=1 Tax=Pseudoalteromonas sp. TaxID=53249 RepID=UPI0023550474|nr:FliM/FliN family flagellar motor C-terminal domain-containing protein [Pseudoalteromonas sp.]